MNSRLFQNPPPDCRGTDFWMLNDKLDNDELLRQLRGMHAQGINSVIARTYIGLKSDYPGADFKSKMRVVVDEAKQLNMTVFMQAAYMPEAVLGLPEKYMLGDIRAFPAGGGRGRLLCSHGGYDYCLVRSNNILDMLSADASGYYVSQCYDKMWSEFRDEFGKTVVSVWVDEPSYGKTELPFTKGLPDAFRDMWGYELPLDKIWLMFEDGEGCERLRYHYRRTVLHLITESYFKKVRDWCSENGLMFSGHLMSEDSMENQIHSSCFTMPCYKYFDIPGIDNLETALDWQYGEIKPKKDYDRYWRDFGHYNTPLQCSSAAHQAGKTRVLCEMYGVSTENLSLRDQKTIFDRFAALGVNHRCVHGLFYSLRGRGKRAYPPHINSYQPYFERYHLLTDTIARESYFLRSGTPRRDTLLIHPMDSAFCLYRAGKESADRRRNIKRYDAKFNQTLRLMVSAQQNFELGDEDSIALWGDITGDKRIKIGKMSYETVILPNCINIRSTTLSLLKKFISAGGKVIVLGDCPRMVDGYESDTSAALAGADRAADHTELFRLMKTARRSYTYDPDDDGTTIEIYYGEDGENKSFFIVNTDCRSGRSGVLTVPESCSVKQFLPESGSIVSYPCETDGKSTRIPINITAGGTLMLRTERRSGTRPLNIPRRVTSRFELNHSWNVKRLEKNALMCEMFRFACEGEKLSDSTYPILAIQQMLSDRENRGNITLSYTFENNIEIRGALLAVENPAEQSVKIDGKPICNQPTGYFLAKAFETIPLPEIGIGRHEIIIERFFEPVGKAKMAVTSLFENLRGAELEPMLILGDFAVMSQIEPTVPNVVRMNPHFVLTGESTRCGDELIKSGYPFYAGAMDMTAEFDLTADEAVRPLSFAVDGLFACTAQVFLNGAEQGDLLWEPYKVRLSGARAGKNILTVRLFGTLRNLLGPWHRPVGEIGAAWGGYSYPNLPWLGADNNDGTVDERWYEDRVPDRGGWTESYLLLPFGLKNAHIVME